MSAVILPSTAGLARATKDEANRLETAIRLRTLFFISPPNIRRQAKHAGRKVFSGAGDVTCFISKVIGFALRPMTNQVPCQELQVNCKLILKGLRAAGVF